jgi:aryl-alcohol dehydrogenase-like predicted oxidoreductase/enamine deaminase RidA (YjgF/YER057c/UK114 family)
MTKTRMETVDLAPGLTVGRIAHGLWQIADMERGGEPIDPVAGAAAMARYADQGFDAFDMADHYGSAEIVAGGFRRAHDPAGRVKLFTKWCPSPDFLDPAAIRAGVRRSHERMGLERIDLMQFHWWRYAHPAYLDCLAEMAAMVKEGSIGALGLTNVDTDHLALILAEGIPISTNQVSFSLIDRRAAGRLSALCLEKDVKLLAYGTLAGGFLSDRWLGAPEPTDIGDWSKMKYKRFIDQAGGWEPFQRLLATLRSVADRHGVGISLVATRWVLDHPAVGCAIVGARLGERDHGDETAGLFDLRLTEADHRDIEVAAADLRAIPGDCGDEYRKPPFLTASGDLSHHLDGMPPVFPVSTDGAGRRRVDTGSEWEAAAGFSRAIRVGDSVLVSGTTATHPEPETGGRPVAPGDPASQTVYILDRIEAAITALGGRMEDVVRTRIYLADADMWEPVSHVHGRVFGDTRPANTLVEVGRLVGDYLVEIEAEAVIA